jgi:hypothetical protein
MKAEAAEFVEEMLRLIRREFFAQVPEKHFWHQKRELELAITQPAEWLRARGGQWVTIGLMRRIVRTVIAAIKKHGDRANIGRFSVYFLHCVQGHMSHHGDEYLQEAKRMPTAGQFVKGAIRDLKAQVGIADPGAVLAETNRVLGRGRRRKKLAADNQPGLFSKLSKMSARTDKIIALVAIGTWLAVSGVVAFETLQDHIIASRPFVVTNFSPAPDFSGLAMQMQPPRKTGAQKPRKFLKPLQHRAP